MKNFLTVSAKTALFGVLGWPVRHSLSPVMQTAALSALGMDAVYLAFEVSPEELGQAVRGAFSLGIGGLNVTVPHKIAVMEHLAEIDEGAKAIGAVNTLVRSEKGWKGYNTDASGFVSSAVRDLGFSPESSSALIYGAGGAARAVICGLAQVGVKCIYISARRPEAAEALASDLKASFPSASLMAVSVAGAEKLLCGGDLLVSATPLGLGAGGSWPFEMKAFDKGVLVYDTAYGMEKTPLEAEAEAFGLKAVSGLGMLVGQGAEALRLWTGVDAPAETMRAALKDFTGR